jgi:hypothetical protein
MLIPWNIYEEDLQTIHENKYDYSKVIWKGVDIDIIVVCPIHGDFEIRPADHKRGRGCQKCSKETHIQYNKLDTDNFIEKSIQIWGNEYDYSKTKYLGTNDKVIIICNKHGEFEQMPSNHYKYGCASCGREKNVRNNKLKEQCKKDFEMKSNKIHNNIYDYTKSYYIDAQTKVIVICKEHGEFNVTPNNHLRGKGCPKCCFKQYSKISIEWLSFMEIKYFVTIKHAQNLGEYLIPNSRYKADGYAENINTIFEFHGDFWHGNPKLYDQSKINPRIGLKFGDLYKKTIEKSKYIKDNGYNIIEIWENDWKRFIKVIIKIQKKWRLKKKL